MEGAIVVATETINGRCDCSSNRNHIGGNDSLIFI